MGTEESKIIERDESDASEEEKEDSLVMRPHCFQDNKDAMATYRCRLYLEGMEQLYSYPKLLRFWKPPFMVKGCLYHISYLACDRCITEDVKPFFTHYPDGWIEKSNEEVMYELAKLE